MTPKLEILPLRPVAPAEEASTLDVLVRVTPPPGAAAHARPRLNLGFALDRSGSMAGAKMVRAREAVCYCLEQLLPADRAAVVIFDTEVQVLVPNTPAAEAAGWTRRVRAVEAGSSTALHEGWVRAGLEVTSGLLPDGLNRVLLVTDGLANVGETNPSRIVRDVAGLRQRGISTTTIGVGDDFNEDLLQAMAEAGDGNAWYVERPEQFSDIFATEMGGLAALFGRNASLGVTPAPRAKVADMLNDLSLLPTGRYALPNLLRERPLDLVLRLSLPGGRAGEELNVASLRLAWDAADGGRRQVLEEPVRIRWAPASEVEQVPANPTVTEAVGLLMAARARQEAMAALDRADHAGAAATLYRVASSVAACPASAETTRELEALETLQKLAADPAEAARARKLAAYQSHHRRHGHRE